MNRRGFTLIELLTAVAFLGLLSGLAIPYYQRLRGRATAASAIGALHVVSTAAYAYMEATGAWPGGESMGTVPAGMSSYLPTGFTFDQPGFRMAWRRDTWVVDGVEQSSQMAQLVADDPNVCDAIDRLLGGRTNNNLLSSCDGRTGLITLYLDN
jgi:prepilin-type N-terminal cleavage/methylation domain-containing protein